MRVSSFLVKSCVALSLMAQGVGASPSEEAMVALRAPIAHREASEQIRKGENWAGMLDPAAMDLDEDSFVINGVDFSQVLTDQEPTPDLEELFAGSPTTSSEAQSGEEDLLAEVNENQVDATVGKLLAEGETTDGAQNEPPSLLGPDLGPQLDFKEQVAKEHYLLEIGDRLLVSIYGEPGTTREVVVDSTGAISYLLVGRVIALGKTIDDLRHELDNKIKETFKYAFVTITPVEFGGQYYTILGEVVQPGKKVLAGKMTLLSALCAAGGFRTGHFRNQTIELADLEHAFLARDGDYVPIDFDRLVMQGDLTMDVVLRPNDYIYIPNSLYKEIHILGEVNIPTTIGFLNTVSLAEALSQARGVTPRASSRAFIIRGALSNPVRIEADINRIFKGKEADVLLQPGDIVYVPVRRFESFREVVKSAIRAFVGAAANEAGNRAFIYIHPHARADTGAIQAVQVIE